jgi:hypothetical protein
MAGVRTITSESDLWALLEYLQGSPVQKDIPDALDISGWNPELLYFPDATRGHIISPSTARAVTGFHKSLARAFAEMAYGEPNARLLTAQDNQQLEIQIFVKDGSNGLQAIGDAINAITSQLAAALVDKMTPEQITVCIVAFLLLYFGQSVAKHWLSQSYAKKQRDTDANERLQLSAEETRRMGIMAAVIAKVPPLAVVEKESRDSHEALVRPVTSVARARVMGTDITGEDARVIVGKPREKAVGKRLDGVFEVVDISNESEEGYTAELLHTESGEKIRVEVNHDTIPKDDIETLFGALRVKGTLITAKANVRYRGDKIVSADIVEAKNVTGQNPQP